MNVKNYKETVAIPEGVTVEVAADGMVSVSGSAGNVKKLLNDPRVKITAEGATITFAVKKYTKSEKMILNTYKAIIKNMLKGVQEEFVYKLKVCSGHFPMNVDLKGQDLTVKNFIGEKIPRTLKLSEEVKAQIDGDIITITSCSKEKAGQAAGSIEKLTRRVGFDRRIFQDGIYITHKGGKDI